MRNSTWILLACCGAVIVGCGGALEGTSGTGAGSAQVGNGGGAGGVGGVGESVGATGSSTGKCPGLLESICSQANYAASDGNHNFLIVLDKSGSMGVTPNGYNKTKWANAIDALKIALDPKNSLLSYGMLLFPYDAATGGTACELQSGDAAVNVNVGPASESVSQINDLMANNMPSGGTPTGAALGAAFDYYTNGAGKALSGAKYVLLVTDGGPNCNASLPCSTDTCTAYMDKSPTLTSCWNGGVANCCDRVNGTVGGVDPQALCLDDATTTAKLRALRNSGINTFVIGIPGSEPYAEYLDSFAVEGGVPVVSKTRKYYDVTTISGLADAIAAITAPPFRDCVVPLAQTPSSLGSINLAVGCALVPKNSGDRVNWTYDTSSQSVVVLEPQCSAIKATSAPITNVIDGCPTVTN